MKTIKQIADELGVNKQKVYRFIVKNHITASSEVKQSKLYDEAAERLIRISNNVEIYRTAALSHFLLTSVLLLPMRFIVRSRVGK